MVELPVGRLQALARLAQFPAHLALAHTAVHGVEERLDILYGAGEEITRAEAQRSHHVGGGCLLGNHDHRHLHVHLAQRALGLTPGQAVEIELAKNDVQVAGIAQRLGGVGHVGGDIRRKTGAIDEPGQGLGALAIVVDDQHLAAVCHLHAFRLGACRDTTPPEALGQGSKSRLGHNSQFPPASQKSSTQSSSKSENSSFTAPLLKRAVRCCR